VWKITVVAILAACSSSTEQPMRAEVKAEEHHGQMFSTLHVRFRDPALRQRLDGLVARVHARCLSEQQVFDDEVEPLTPWLADDHDPNHIHTTDDLEATLFSYEMHPMFGVPDHCDLAVTARRNLKQKPVPLVEACLHADHEITAGRCRP
jgi:hypothetical protein